jgi:hydrogenase nickel incorporation protein HypA/HybF
MHELSLMECVVSAVEEQVAPARVVVVRLQVGRLAAVVPEALRFCFGVCAQATLLDGAELEIEVVDGRARCRDCDAELVVRRLGEPCGCGSNDLDIVAGLELKVTEVEVIGPAAVGAEAAAAEVQ